MPVNVSNPEDLRGVEVTGADGDKLGKVDEVYLDNETSKPEWAAVKTGLFGGNISLVPLAAADWDGSKLSVPYAKDMVKNAPNHDPGAEISVDDERELFTYYGVPYGGDTVTATGGPDTGTGTATTDTGRTTVGTVDTGTVQPGTVDTGTTYASGTDATTVDRTDTVGHDTSGPNTDDAMTRSEERLRVGTETREAGKARLRKYITSETVTRTVPVTHEEVTVEREAITDANVSDALSGGDLTEEVHEVTLHEQAPVVAKETVPVERIRLGTQEVTEQQTVSADVRKENIEIEGDDVPTSTTGR